MFFVTTRPKSISSIVSKKTSPSEPAPDNNSSHVSESAREAVPSKSTPNSRGPFLDAVSISIPNLLALSNSVYV